MPSPPPPEKQAISIASKKPERKSVITHKARSVTRVPVKHASELDRTLLDHPETEYQRSLGFRIAFHQAERKMSDQDVVDAIKASSKANEHIDKALVRKWQNAQQLPSDNAMAALVITLIDENNNIADADKQKATEAFYAAYERTKAVLLEIKTGKVVDRTELYAFSNQLIALRVNCGFDESAPFIEAIAKNAVMDIPEIKDGTLDQLLMIRIHGNDYTPSKGLMVAMVRAMDRQKPIDEDDKQKLYDLHDGLQSNDCPIASQEKQVLAVPEHIVAMKAKLLGYFTDVEGSNVGITKVIQETGLAATTQLMGNSRNLPNVMRPETMEDYSAKFTTYLRTLGKGDDTIKRFNDDFTTLNDAVKEQKKKLRDPNFK